MINCIDSYQLINPNKKYYENLQDRRRQFKLFSSTLFSGEKKKGKDKERDKKVHFAFLIRKRGGKRKEEGKKKKGFH